jgi:hypothetical protein
MEIRHVPKLPRYYYGILFVTNHPKDTRTLRIVREAGQVTRDKGMR